VLKVPPVLLVAYIKVATWWLLDNITRQVGDGVSTLFLVDPWLDGKPLYKGFV